MKAYYLAVKQYVVPIAFPLIFTPLALVFPLIGLGREISLTSLITTASRIDNYAVITVAIYLIWSITWLKIPSNRVCGPTTMFGQTPNYQDNGFQYYIASVVLILLTYYIRPDWAVLAYERMPELVALLNVLALSLCVVLTIKGLFFAEFKEKIEAPSELLFNILYRFWCGSELHPKIWGMDIKQLNNCRIGILLWQHLIIAFFVAHTTLYGFSLPHFYNVLLQTVYLLKFYYWESGYFQTFDILEDRASYYLCWGCTVWLPVFYTWSTYYMVGKQAELSTAASTGLAAAGLVAILLSYLVDLERQFFRRTGRSFMPGATRKMKVTYKDDKGKVHQTALLTSGFWGAARHLNYTIEILLTACWCLQGWGTGYLAPNLCLIFVVIVLLHRFYRDQERCIRKYGAKQWGAYCNLVPYWFIPYIF